MGGEEVKVYPIDVIALDSVREGNPLPDLAVS
jgi:hypothetical protein